MRHKRTLFFVLLIAVLALLIYLQVRAWKRFDWASFRDGLEGLNNWSFYWRVLVAIALIYCADALRALRWKIFLRPTRPGTSWLSLIAPQYIGFTGLALLGRPGEFIRPYLIAKRVNTTMAPQVAIWLVERVFDTGAVVAMFALDVLLSPRLHSLDRFVPVILANDQSPMAYSFWQKTAVIFGLLFVAMVLGVWSLWLRGPAIAAWTCRRLSRISPAVGSSVEKKMTTMSSGLHTIRDVGSFLQITGISFAIWLIVAVAYCLITRAYGRAPLDLAFPILHAPGALSFSEAVLLMFASVAGGVITLPLVGGGTQLATIAVLSNTFGYADAPEIAVSCGMLLWLVTFMSIIPGGLVLARREHVSLRRLESEAGAEAKTEHATGPALPLP